MAKNVYQIEILLSNSTRRLPCQRFLDALEGMEMVQLKWLGKKGLTTSDVNSCLQRLFIPSECIQLLKHSNHLWPEEVEEMERKDSRGILVAVVGDDGRFLEMAFKRWSSVKAFVLSGKAWQEFVERNELCANRRVEIWAFRYGHREKLGFAIGTARS